MSADNRTGFESEMRRLDRSGFPKAIHFIDPDEELLARVKNGVLVIVAGWSGAAKLAFGVLSEATSEFLTRGVSMYVIDHDELDGKAAERVLGTLPQGWGETYWVRDGRIVHSLSRYDQSAMQAIKNFTATL